MRLSFVAILLAGPVLLSQQAEAEVTKTIGARRCASRFAGTISHRHCDNDSHCVKLQTSRGVVQNTCCVLTREDGWVVLNPPEMAVIPVPIPVSKPASKPVAGSDQQKRPPRELAPKQPAEPPAESPTGTPAGSDAEWADIPPAGQPARQSKPPGPPAGSDAEWADIPPAGSATKPAPKPPTNRDPKSIMSLANIME